MKFSPLFFQACLCAALVVACALAWGAASPYAVAQGAQRNSSGEDVLIAFLKTGNAAPDYTAMAKEHPDYKHVPVARLEAFLEKQRRRLVQRWQAYDPAVDGLTVRVPVRVELFTEYDETSGEPVATHRMAFSLEQDKELFFPYIHAGYEIAVIPQRYESLMHQPLPKAQYDLIYQSLGGRTQGQAFLWFHLKPASADTSQPYRLSGREQWLFLTDITGANLLSSDGMTLWSHSAADYISPVTHELMDMYDENQRERQGDGSPVIPPSSQP